MLVPLMLSSLLRWSDGVSLGGNPNARKPEKRHGQVFNRIDSELFLARKLFTKR